MVAATRSRKKTVFSSSVTPISSAAAFWAAGRIRRRWRAITAERVSCNARGWQQSDSRRAPRASAKSARDEEVQRDAVIEEIVQMLGGCTHQQLMLLCEVLKATKDSLQRYF